MGSEQWAAGSNSGQDEGLGDPLPPRVTASVFNGLRAVVAVNDCKITSWILNTCKERDLGSGTSNERHETSRLLSAGEWVRGSLAGLRGRSGKRIYGAERRFEYESIVRRIAKYSANVVFRMWRKEES